jgi:hypothetical protein
MATTKPPTKDDEWETLSNESPMVVEFDTIGDVFMGEFLYDDHIVPEEGRGDPFDRYVFIDRTEAHDGDRVALNHTYQIERAMETVKPGDWVRVTYIKDIPTGRKLNPMKDFKIDVKRQRR